MIGYLVVVDGLSTMLDAHRGRGAFALRCEMAPPWAVRVADEAAVGLIVMVRGSCVIVLDGDEPVSLQAGDVALAKGARPYTLSDHEETPPGVVIEPGQVCRVLDTAYPAPAMELGTRSWGNARGGPCAFLTGTYEHASQVSGRLLSHLPALAVLRAPSCDPGLLQLLGDEMARELPGQDVLLNRYVDLVLVSALRQWFGRPDAPQPRWWAAQSDPLVGQLLALMHDRPAEPWTLARLAAGVGYSRASVVRRFTELVGQAPMSYLTEWRLTLAADLLTSTDDSVEAVGRAVGYENPFAFSTAFKRAAGSSPRAFRHQAQSAVHVPASISLADR